MGWGTSGHRSRSLGVVIAGGSGEGREGSGGSHARHTPHSRDAGGVPGPFAAAGDTGSGKGGADLDHTSGGVAADRKGGEGSGGYGGGGYGGAGKAAHEVALDRMLGELLRFRMAARYGAREPPPSLLQRGGHIVILCDAGVSYESLAHVLEPLRTAAAVWHTYHTVRRGASAPDAEAAEGDTTGRRSGTTGPTVRHVVSGVEPPPVVILHPTEPSPSDWAALLPRKQSTGQLDHELVVLPYDGAGAVAQGTTTRSARGGGRGGGARGGAPEGGSETGDAGGSMVSHGGGSAPSVGTASLGSGSVGSLHGSIMGGLLAAHPQVGLPLPGAVAGAARAQRTYAALAASTHRMRLPGLGNLFLVRGNPLRYADVSRCGILTAKRVVIMSDASTAATTEAGAQLWRSANDARGVANDSSALFTFTQLRAKLGALQPPTIVELVYDSSLAFLHTTISTLLSSAGAHLPLAQLPALMDTVLRTVGARALSLEAVEEATAATADARPPTSPRAHLQRSAPRSRNLLLADDAAALAATRVIMRGTALACSMVTEVTGPAVLYVPAPAMVTYVCASRAVQSVLRGQLQLGTSAGWPTGNLSAVRPPDAPPAAAAAAAGITTTEHVLPHKRRAVASVSDDTFGSDLSDATVIPEFAQGTAASSSLCEALLANNFYEPHCTSVLRALVTSTASQLVLMKVPAHLAVNDVLPPGRAAAGVSAACVGYVEYATLYAYLMETLGAVPMGIMRHAARLRRGYADTLQQAAAAAAVAMADSVAASREGRLPPASQALLASVRLADRSTVNTLQQYYAYRLPRDARLAAASPMPPHDVEAALGVGGGGDSTTVVGTRRRAPVVAASPAPLRAPTPLLYHAGDLYNATRVLRSPAPVPPVAGAAKSVRGDTSNPLAETPLPPLLPMNYCVTAPAADTKVKVDDLVVVVVSTVSPAFTAATLLQRWYRRVQTRRAAAMY